MASICEQDYQGAEILAWDNGSTDQTVDILRKWIPGKIPGRIVTDQPCVLLGECLGRMVEEARTPFLARIDGDDINMKNRLSLQVDFLKKNPDFVAVGSWFYEFGNGPEIKVNYPATSAVGALWMNFWGNFLAHPTMMLRRDVVIKAGNYSSMGMGQDYDLWYRLFQVGKIMSLPKYLVRRRVHATSVSSEKSNEWSSLGWELFQKYRQHFFCDTSEEILKKLWDFFSPYSQTQFRSDVEREEFKIAVSALQKQTKFSPVDWYLGGEFVSSLSMVHENFFLRQVAKILRWRSFSL